MNCVTSRREIKGSANRRAVAVLYQVAAPVKARSLSAAVNCIRVEIPPP